jgi:Short C-terminal domain
MRPVGGIDALSGRLRKRALRSLEPDERVLFCVVGRPGQALVALDRRLLLLKVGAAAGRAFRGMVASYRYADIAEISLRLGEVNSVIRVSPLEPRAREWWQWPAASEDPLRAPDSLLIPSSTAAECQWGVERLRELVAGARGEGPPSLVSELERLAALHAAGALSDDEFRRAKETLLA